MNDAAPIAAGAVLPGLLFGLGASFGWSIYNVGLEIGHAQGFTSADLTLLRYLGGALVMVPLMLALRISPLRGLTWARLAALTIVAGPPFALLVTTGFATAPLAHAVVIGPGTTMLGSAALARLVDKAPLNGARLTGMGLLVLGLILIAADRSGAPHQAAPGRAWIGDLCFLASGALWGTFTWLISRWRVDPVAVTGAIALGSTAIFAPVYLLAVRPAVTDAGLWALQFLYQGALGGALAIVFYAAAIRRLGAIGAGIFPALVPPLAILIAAAMTGRLPNGLQAAGIAAATLGLLVAINLPGLALRRWRLRNPDRGKALR